MVYLRVTSALAAAALLTLVPHAQAQSLPPEGELHVTFTATQVPPVNPMLIGEGKQYVAQNLIMSASNDQGNAVLNNIAGRCQMNLPGAPTSVASPRWPRSFASHHNHKSTT